MGVALAHQFCVDENFLDENIRQQSAITILSRLPKLNSDRFTRDEQVVRLRGWFAVSILLFRGFDAEISDSAAVLQLARVAIDHLADNRRLFRGGQDLAKT